MHRYKINISNSEGYGELLPDSFRDVPGQKMPPSCRELLFGDEPICTLTEGMYFFSVYVSFLKSAGFCIHGSLKSFIERTSIIHQKQETKELAHWFRMRFLQRISQDLRKELELLLERKLTWDDIAGTLLHAGMQVDVSEPPLTDCFSLESAWLKHKSMYSEYELILREDKCQLSENDHELWPDTEVLRLACDWSLKGQGAKFILKQLRPYEYHLVLEVLNKTWHLNDGSQAYRAFIKWNRDLSEKCRRIRHQWLAVPFWVEREVAVIEYSPHEPYLPLSLPRKLLNCISFVQEGVELTFPFPFEGDGGKYRIDCQKWEIIYIEDENIKKTDLYLNLKPIDHRINKEHRGENDIFVRFLSNLDYFEKNCDSSAALRAERRVVNAILYGCLEFILSKCKKKPLNFARQMATGPEQSWTLYRLAEKYGVESPEVNRIKQFRENFPACFMALPSEPLKEVIVPAERIRGSQWFPYWSKYFRRAAARRVGSFREAVDELYRAIALTLGVHKECVEAMSELSENMCFFGMKSPFEKISRPAEAFLVWSLHFLQEEKIDLLSEETAELLMDLHDIKLWCEEVNFIPDRYSTLKSLQRHRQTYYEKIQKRKTEEALRENIPFSPPWTAANWVNGRFKVVYIASPRELYQQARSQENCVFLWLDRRIRDDIVQIYSLQDIEQNTILGTIAIESLEEKSYTCIEALGPKNKKLTAEEQAAVQAWLEDFPESSHVSALKLLSSLFFCCQII